MSTRPSFWTVILIFAALATAEDAFSHPSTLPRWQVYRNPKFGFALLVPPAYRMRSYGPNLTMRDLMVGQAKSGTIPPSYDTIAFSAPGWPSFHVVVHPRGLPFDPDGVLGGHCGSQFADETLINRLVTVNGIDFLERRQAFRGRIGIDYCFLSGGGYLITLRAEDIAHRDAARIDRLLRSILATVSLHPPGR